MRVFYYSDKGGNFGDDLNEWMWKAVWPELPEERDDQTLLVGIGTIIGLKLPEGKWKKIVVGSGVGYMNVPKLDDSWEFLAVRGPLSAKALGLKPEVAVTDGAALLRTLPAYAKPAKKREGVVFMPHLSARTGRWEEVCAKAGITYIDPQWDSKLLLEKIQSAELVLADAMHAAITADTLRVNWVPVAISNDINSFKWVDWASSLQMPYKPTYLPASSLIEWARNLAIQLLSTPYRAPMRVINAINTQPDMAEDILMNHHMKRYAGGKMKTCKERLLVKYVLPILKRLRRTKLPLLWAPIDQLMIANAARKLQAAAKGPSYMSDEAVLDNAIARLKAALKKIG